LDKQATRLFGGTGTLRRARSYCHVRVVLVAPLNLGAGIKGKQYSKMHAMQHAIRYLPDIGAEGLLPAVDETNQQTRSIKKKTQ